MVKGFKAAGIAAGIKKDGGMDLGMMVSEVPAAVAGVFTRNKVRAAPVILDQERIKSGPCRAVIVNSGNANCCTGGRGMQDARRMAEIAASVLDMSADAVLVASTGVIGQPLPVQKIEAAASRLAGALSDEGFSDLAAAIMTTDTVPKMTTRRGEINGQNFSVVGVAKGAGMIRPDMATLLCFVATDAVISPDNLQLALAAAAEKSFNRITVDGDTSTNDTVLIMANGMSGASVDTPAAERVFQSMIDDVLITLAKMVVRDGEGATKLVEISVKGATAVSDAKRAADTVAHSNLVKTALFGEDANWGRIMAALGRSGARMDPADVDIWFNDVRLVGDGQWCGPEAEAAATDVLKTPEFAIRIDLKQGQGAYFCWTCDFSVDYVKINANYRS